MSTVDDHGSQWTSRTGRTVVYQEEELHSPDVADFASETPRNSPLPLNPTRNPQDYIHQMALLSSLHRTLIVSETTVEAVSYYALTPHPMY
jgi:hypothetical protein